MDSKIIELYQALNVNYTNHIVTMPQAWAVHFLNAQGVYDEVEDNILLLPQQRQSYANFVALHELIHWTMNRVGRNWHHLRAAEEAIADLGALKLAEILQVEVSGFNTSEHVSALALQLFVPQIGTDIDNAIQLINDLFAKALAQREAA